MKHEVNCKFCGRYLFTATSTTIVEQVPCGNSKCRAKLNIKVVTPESTMEQMRYKFKAKETPPKEKKHG